MRRRFFLVFNPLAGVSRRAAVEAVAQRLITGGGDVMWSSATTAGGACAAVREAAVSGAFDAVIAAGGDGTIRQAAAGIAGTDIPLGIVPLGTGNVLAHELALDRRPEALAQMLREGPAQPMTYGLANGAPFLLMVGAGFDGRIIAALDHGLKNKIAKLAYAGPALGAFLGARDELTIDVDGQRHEAMWAVIANARHYGGRFVMAPRTGIDQPGLQAILFKNRSRSALFAQLLALAAGRLEKRQDVVMIGCRRAAISAVFEVPLQIDGDTAGHAPVDVVADAGTIPLIRALHRPP
jgi:diacylglycerol kinase (ATP)